MYTEGSNALKKEYYTNAQSHTSVKNNPVNKTEVRQLRLTRRQVAQTVCIAVMLFVGAMLLIAQNVAVNKEFGLLAAAKEKLDSANAKVVEQQMYAEGNLDPKRIEQEAQRLGLQQPVKKQIKYISLGNTDNGEVLKVEEKGGISAFISRMSVILEYLY